EDALLGLLGHLGLGLDDHVGGALEHARGLERRAAAGVDLDEAHPAHAHRLHPGVGAEARDVDAVALGRVDDELALARRHHGAVDGDADALHGGLHLLRHGHPPGAGRPGWTCGPASPRGSWPRTRRGTGRWPTRWARRPRGPGDRWWSAWA